MLARSEVLMIGPYPAWDMEDLDARYVVHKLWEAADRDRLIDANRGAIRATATRCELGASGAGLDDWNEPHIDARFKGLDNVVLQPHHASGTIETRRAMGKLVRDNLAEHFSGAALLTPVL